MGMTAALGFADLATLGGLNEHGVRRSGPSPVSSPSHHPDRRGQREQRRC